MLVMDFLKRYPIPIAGLILGLFALGNLVQSYSNEARHVIGVIGFILYVPYLLKVLVLNSKLSDPLSNPVAASVFPTFTMATMLLAGYIKPYCPECASIVWYAGVIGHVLLIIWFTLNFVVKGFAVKKVFPSWFIVYVGIAVASVSAPVTGMLNIGQYAFWFGLVTYILLLVVVCYRVWIVFRSTCVPVTCRVYGLVPGEKRSDGLRAVSSVIILLGYRNDLLHSDVQGCIHSESFGVHVPFSDKRNSSENVRSIYGFHMAGNFV